MDLHFSLRVYGKDSITPVKDYKIKNLNKTVAEFSSFYLGQDFQVSLLFLVDGVQVNQSPRRSFSNKIHLKNWLFSLINAEQSIENPNSAFIYVKLHSLDGTVLYERFLQPLTFTAKRLCNLIESKAHSAYLNNDLLKIEIALHSGLGVTERVFLDNVNDLKGSTWQRAKANVLTFANALENPSKEKARAVIFNGDEIIFSLEFDETTPFVQVISRIENAIIFNSIEKPVIGIALSTNPRQMLVTSFLLTSKTKSSDCVTQIQNLFHSTGLLL